MKTMCMSSMSILQDIAGKNGYSNCERHPGNCEYAKESPRSSFPKDDFEAHRQPLSLSQGEQLQGNVVILLEVIAGSELTSVKMVPIWLIIHVDTIDSIYWVPIR